MPQMAKASAIKETSRAHPLAARSAFNPKLTRPPISGTRKSSNVTIIPPVPLKGELRSNISFAMKNSLQQKSFGFFC
jgi:hypothetical protein